MKVLSDAILFYEQIKELSISELREKINFGTAYPLKNLTLGDLSLTISVGARSPLGMCNGVYIIFNPRYLYVGMSGSRTFIERLAAHFALRSSDYMNHLIKKLAKKNGVTFLEAATDIFESSRALFIALDYSSDDKAVRISNKKLAAQIEEAVKRIFNTGNLLTSPKREGKIENEQAFKIFVEEISVKLNKKNRAFIE